MEYALNLVNNDLKELEFSNKLLNSFINYADVNDITLKGYRTYLKTFFNYLKDKEIKQPNRQDIKNYKNYLEDLKLATGTKQQYFRTCKLLFKWLASEGIYPNIADNIKGFKYSANITKKESLNENDIKAILNKIDTSSIRGKRDYAIILLILTGGLRINEIRNMDIQDIEIIKGEYVVYVLGKGHTEKDVYIKIIEPVYKAIKDYLDSRGKVNKTDPLFTSISNRTLNLSSESQRITKESLSQIIKKRFRNAGYDSPKFSAHSLRHSSNTLLFKSGADLYRVQRHARHSDPKTTEIYIHMTEREDNTDELDIYNQIFNTENQDIINELRTSLNTLNYQQLQNVLNYVKTLN